MVSLTLLGALTLTPDDGRPLPPAALQRRRLALLALLALARDRGVSRERLQAALWPESAPDRARHALDQLLYATRRDLGRETVLSGTSTLRLNREAVRVDLWAFEDAVRDARWADAVALYAGPLLDGVSLADDADDAREVDGRRERLRLEHRRALAALAHAADACGHRTEALRWCQALAAAEPLAASGALALMRALAAAGDRAGAVRHARIHARLVREELGADPDPEVEALAMALALAPEPRGVRPQVTPSAAAADLELAQSQRAHPELAVVGTLPATPATAVDDAVRRDADVATAVPLAGDPLRTPRGRTRRDLRAMLAAAAGIALLGATSALWRRPHPVDAAGAPGVVAVLPFRATGGADAAALAGGMPILLSANLDGAGDIRGVDPRALLAYVDRTDGNRASDPEAGDAAAAHFGAGLFLLGDVVQVGPRLRITGALYDRARSGRVVAEASVEGTTAEFFGLVDRLTADLVVGRERGPRGRLARLASTTTTSYAALKAYLEGESAMRAGRYHDAAAAFGRAVATDTTFALADYRLSTVWMWIDATQASAAHAARALRHAGRLSDRERMLLVAARAEQEGDGARAEQLYRAIVGRHPDDVETWLRLGETLFHTGPLRGSPTPTAHDAFARVLALDPGHAEAVLHLARLAALRRDQAAYDSLAARYLALAGASAQAWEIGVVSDLRRGEPGARARRLAELEGAPDGRIYSAVRNVAIYGADVADAERLAKLMTAPQRVAETRALGHVLTAYLHVARGRPRAARAALAQAVAIDRLLALEHGALLETAAWRPDRPWEAPVSEDGAFADPTQWPAPGGGAPSTPHPSSSMEVRDGVHAATRAFALGLRAARTGDAAAAERHATEAERAETGGPVPGLARDLATSVRAHLAARRGREAEALALLDRAPVRAPMQHSNFSPLFNRAHDRFLRAELLWRAGRDAEAVAWYTALGGDSFFDLPYLARAHWRLAKLHERRGDRAGAVASLRRFVALWQDAEPELRPVVDDARRALARLMGGAEADVRVASTAAAR